jgi:PhoPQ-activated pathogenicity-related protein
LIKPSSLDQGARQAVLVIGGGRWHDELSDPSKRRKKFSEETALFGLLAEQTRSPVAVISQVPFQPMFDGKVEDAIISLTFENFLKTGDPEWPLLLPMVKSAVRAMDTAQAYCRDEWSIPIDAFTVTGGSKRGWTTWLTGAVDPRATAIAPMVIDVLNMNQQMKHQVDSWGKYSEQIEDYTERGLQQNMETDKGKSLLEIVDPYSYRHVLNQPKLIMIGTNDRYWPLDALNLYWNELSGQNYILYVPNNGHGLRDFPRIIGGLKAIHEQASGKKSLPKLTWHFQPNGKSLQLKVKSDISPTKVQIWLASSDTRDFRESMWKAEPAEANGDSYDYELAAPAAGYAAMFAEAVYPNEGMAYYLSTNVRIVSAADESVGDRLPRKPQGGTP